jgi:hypothetical protein
LAPLVHVGYHRTGADWLGRFFFDDPSTGYSCLGKDSPSNPVHRIVQDRLFEFDADAVRDEFAPLLEEARAADRLPVVSFSRLSGHPYSGGYDSKELADRLKAVFPDARVLIVIREQCSMVVSTVKQYLAAGGVLAVPRFLERTPEYGWRVPMFDFGHFEYDRLIRYYRSLYGDENVLGLPYEQFTRDARGFVSAIARFAGRPVSEQTLDRLPYTHRTNQAPPALAATLTRPLNRFGPRSDANPTPLLGSRIPVPLTRGLRRRWLWRIPPLRGAAADAEDELHRYVATTIGDRYAASNRATAELTGADLSEYGWRL